MRFLLLFLNISLVMLILTPKAYSSKNCSWLITGDLDPRLVDTEQEREAGYGWYEPELIHVLPKDLAYRLHELKFYDYGQVSHYHEIRRFIEAEFTSEKFHLLTPNQIYALFKLTAEMTLHSLFAEDALAADAIALLANKTHQGGASGYALLSTDQQTNIRISVESYIQESYTNPTDIKKMLKSAEQFGTIPH